MNRTLRPLAIFVLAAIPSLFSSGVRAAPQVDLAEDR